MAMHSDQRMPVFGLTFIWYDSRGLSPWSYELACSYLSKGWGRMAGLTPDSLPITLFSNLYSAEGMIWLMADITHVYISNRTLPAGRTKLRLIFFLTCALYLQVLRAHSETALHRRLACLASHHQTQQRAPSRGAACSFDGESGDAYLHHFLQCCPVPGLPAHHLCCALQHLR